MFLTDSNDPVKIVSNKHPNRYLVRVLGETGDEDDRFIVAFSVQTSSEDYDEIIDWVYENCSEKVHNYKEGDEHTRWIFENDEDAALFKLRWGGSHEYL